MLQTARARISNLASGGQCHLIHFTILGRISWPSLACTKVAIHIFFTLGTFEGTRSEGQIGLGWDFSCDLDVSSPASCLSLVPFAFDPFSCLWILCCIVLCLSVVISADINVLHTVIHLAVILVQA